MVISVNSSFLLVDGGVLGMSALGLEFDELLGDIVAGALGKNSQNRPSGLVQSDTLGQRTPTGAAAALGHVSQL